MLFLKFDKTQLVNLEYALQREVLRTNRAGSYSCTTIVGCNTRKYHGLLVSPVPSLDEGKHVLLSSFDETVIQHEKEFNLGLHKYEGDNYEPKGHKYIRDFCGNPVPKLQYRVGGVVISKEKVFVENDAQMLIKYTLEEATSPTKMRFKAFLAFRNIHKLSKANMDVNTKFEEVENGISVSLYDGYPNLFMQFSKKVDFVPAPDWYYNVEYYEEQKRGYDYKEDLFVPGYFEMPIKKGESVIFSAAINKVNSKGLKQRFTSEIKNRIPRDNFEHCLLNSISQFFVQYKKNNYIIAGYPWLPIRSRDALIALPGLTQIDKNAKQFRSILSSLINNLKGHLLPEIIDDNQNVYSVDNSLWIIRTIEKLKTSNDKIDIWKDYGKVIKRVINGYLKEKELFEVRENGLIYILDNTFASSWMNSYINGEPAVKRSGYLVELNALWYNAICFALEFKTKNSDVRWFKKLESIKENIDKSFVETFWIEDKKYLADFVTDSGQNLQIRPNQIFAVSFAYSPLSKDYTKLVLDIVNSQLLTPFGLRTLNPEAPDYCPKYEGNHNEREKAAFNGSVWPWLYTSYIEALMKIQPKKAMQMGRRFLKTFEPEMLTNGICSISEVYDGDPPQKGKGAISFAKNTGELIRLMSIIEVNEDV